MVIVSGGANTTPGILERSGLGNAQVLEQAGIAVLEHLPSVGNDFQDHHLSLWAYRINLTTQETINGFQNGPFNVDQAIKNTDELLGTNGMGTQGMFRPTEAEVEALGPEFKKAWDQDFTCANSIKSELDGNGSDSTEQRDSSANPPDEKHGIYAPDEEQDIYDPNEEHDVYNNEEEHDFCKYDIAITHHRNTELKEQLNQFIQDAQNHKSLQDPQTRSWLADLPFSMRNDVIPLFTHGDDSGDASEDYHLHPCRSWLDVDTNAAEPDKELFCLIKDEKTLKDPDSVTAVIGIGRLFINASTGIDGRTS